MRPREHYRVHGPDTLADDALLALVIGTGVRTSAGARSTLEIARDLLTRWQGLAGLHRASVQGLAGVPGLGPERAVRLHAALVTGRRACRPPAHTPPHIRTPEEAWAALAPLLEPCETEELHALYLGPRGQLLAHRCLTRGSDRHTVVDPRQVFRTAVEVGAASVIVAHNHPSGDPTPSGPDEEVTRRLAAAGRVLGIALLDHLVLGRGTWRSLAEAGLLPAWAPDTRSWVAHEDLRPLGCREAAPAPEPAAACEAPAPPASGAGRCRPT